ncbi:hypothetical protein RFI_34818 [Reticulomyxa filosa]|uniref:TRAF-type domain-containing protein n=1 Tax=Reticulomyxa filosa TaxID=46433 RepID=X6LLU6_RETFI|nr:hypothetical protein RFI_34818 [Reticulomyxa filosa]|eukprot:ETO02599.1 hypothetical protein RFI_34818 [Reticulomyxa filosa]
MKEEEKWGNNAKKKKKKSNKSICIKKQYVVNRCNGVIRDAVELRCSHGHLYCQKCIENESKCRSDSASGKQYQCVSCKDASKSYNSFYPNLYCRKKIEKQAIVCPLNKPLQENDCKCEWEGTLSQLEKHLNEECGLNSARYCQCLYHTYGCSVKCENSNALHQHLNDSHVSHLSLVTKTVAFLFLGKHMRIQKKKV